jgi:hypothetical protein
MVVAGCSGESEQERYNRRRHEDNQKMGEQSQREQLEADATAEASKPTPEPEPTEEPTPIPRDEQSDIVYTPHGNYRVYYGEAAWGDNGVLIYRTVEVEEGDNNKDIVWVMPSGVIIVTEKYRYKVKKVAQ